MIPNIPKVLFPNEYPSPVVLYSITVHAKERFHKNMCLRSHLLVKFCRTNLQKLISDSKKYMEMSCYMDKMRKQDVGVCRNINQKWKSMIGVISPNRVINKSNMKGGDMVDETVIKELQQLIVKVAQNEETITQLLEIIATTKRRVSHLYDDYFVGSSSSIPASMFSSK